MSRRAEIAPARLSYISNIINNTMGNVSPTIYVGLGKAGTCIIDNIKKQYIAEYGDVPSCIQFLGISFSYAFTGTVLSDSEQASLDIAKPLESYMAIKDSISWMPERNIKYLPFISSFGCGHIRTNGRFAFVWNYDKVYKAALNIMSRFSDSSMTPTIKIITSMSGGTGSAIAPSIAYLFNNITSSNDIQLFAILPQVYINAGDCLALTSSNAYESVRELDYIMTKTSEENPFIQEFIGGKKEYYSAPFRHVFAFNTKLGIDINAFEHKIASTIKLSGDLAGNIGSFLDNIQMSILDGINDVDDKKAWVCLISSDVHSLSNETDEERLKAISSATPYDMCPINRSGYMFEGLNSTYIQYNPSEIPEKTFEALLNAFEQSPIIVNDDRPLGKVSTLSITSANPAFFIDGLLHYAKYKEMISEFIYIGIDSALTEKLDSIGYTLQPDETKVEKPVINEEL